MDFHFTPEQQQFRDAVSGFAEKRLKAGALKRAHQTEHPFDIAKLMAEQGLMGIAFPEADGGLGMTTLDLSLVLAECGRALAPCPLFGSLAGTWGTAFFLLSWIGSQSLCAFRCVACLMIVSRGQSL